MKIEDIKAAAKEANFMQWFKAEIWKRMEGGFLPEKKLDEIAARIYEYFRAEKKQKNITS